MQGLRDILRSLSAWQIWCSIAVDDTIGRYRRTLLGPLWLVIAQAAFIFGLYYLHKRVMGAQEGNYLLFLAASLPIWSLVVSGIVEGSTALLRSKSYIDSFPLPMGIYIIRSVAANFITFAHLIVVFFIVMIFMRVAPSITMVAVIPALVILAVFGVGIGLLIAPLSGRYRDLSPAIAAITNLMFVLTPVFWVPTAEQRASILVKFNPAFYLVDVARQPLLGNWGAPDVWLGATLVAVVTLVLGGVVFARMRPTIVYWL